MYHLQKVHYLCYLSHINHQRHLQCLHHQHHQHLLHHLHHLHSLYHLHHLNHLHHLHHLLHLQYLHYLLHLQNLPCPYYQTIWTILATYTTYILTPPTHPIQLASPTPPLLYISPLLMQPLYTLIYYFNYNYMPTQPT